MQVITVETDSIGAAGLAEAAAEEPGAVFDARQVQAQVGDPDTWMFVAEMAPTAGAALGAMILTLIRQRKIKYLKINGIEFRDITADQLAKVAKALGITFK